MVRRILILGVVLTALSVAAAGEDNAAGTRILDTKSYWRVHATLRPPVFGTADDAGPDAQSIPLEYRKDPETGKRKGIPIMPEGQPFLPWPDAGWMKPDFDDSGWWRDPGPFYGTTGKRPYGQVWCHGDPSGGAQPRALALFCVRGKFTVTDPSKVTALKLNATFRGGLIVYLNGKEVHRAHMGSGKKGFDVLAEDYPPEAYTSKGNTLRIRKVGDVALPVSELRKGTNVLALEIHRAALPQDKVKQNRRKMWSSVGLPDVRVEADGSGVVPNTTRPNGLQVWNAASLESIFDTDYGEPHERLLPIRIVGTPGGTFSGQVVVGSDAPIKGMSANIGPLKMKDRTLPAAGVEIFYPRPTSMEKNNKVVLGGSRRFDALAETPAKEVAVKKLKKPVPGLGAVQPVWVRAAIPRDAQPGTYTGTLSVRVESKTVSEIPVQVEVLDFRLPETRDFHTWVDFIQSPETLAIRYKVPMWSDKHFELIGRTFRLLAGVGNKTLYIPLICKTNLGNGESMMRWIEKKGGGYDHDFSVVEKYLDCALKCLLSDPGLPGVPAKMRDSSLPSRERAYTQEDRLVPVPLLIAAA
ncbi:glycoside hydrolase domain-containing protein [Planctomycetota bacterium]